MVRHDLVAQEREDASKAAAGRLITRLGAALERLDVWVSEAPDDEKYVTGLNFRVRYDTEGDVLAVVKADTADGPIVGFHSAETVSAALLGLLARMDNGSLKWREDIPYAKRSNNAASS